MFFYSYRCLIMARAKGKKIGDILLPTDPAALAELSIEEIENYAKAAKKVIMERQKKQRDTALHNIVVATLEHQFALEEIVAYLYENQAIFDKSYQNGQPMRIYQNPNNPTEMWCGSGRQPDWLREFVALGHDLEEFAMFKELRAQYEQLEMTNKLINRCKGKKPTTTVGELGEVSTQNAATLLQMAADDTAIVQTKIKNENRKETARKRTESKKKATTA